MSSLNPACSRSYRAGSSAYGSSESAPDHCFIVPSPATRRCTLILPYRDRRPMRPFDALPGASYSARMATRTSSANAVAANNHGRGDRVVTSNRRAFYDFHILESVEAGIVLTGTEIKSIRDGKATIAEAYARFENGE